MDAQSRCARHQCCNCIYVERNHAANTREHEWIPAQRGKKIAMEELDAAPRHSAGDARQVGEIVKHAARPGQPKGQPGSCKAE